VFRIVQRGMRASSMSMKNPGAPRVRSNGFWMSRRAIVSD